MNRTLTGFVLAWVVATGGAAWAGATSKLAREAAEYMLKRFERQAARDSVESMTLRIETLALKHGDEVYQAARRAGPRGLKLLEEAGEHGPQAARLMARHGDDALWVVARPSRMQLVARHGDEAAAAMVRHGEIAEPLVATFGKPAAAALSSVGSQNARRLAMMADDGSLAKIGQTSKLLAVVGRYGDRAMEFVWKHKAALAVAAGLTAFLANPQPFLDGTKDLAQVVAENAVKPLAEASGEVAVEAARNTSWTLAVIAAIVVGGAYISWRTWLKQRAAPRPLQG
jgi:hypothetical protein